MNWTPVFLAVIVVVGCYLLVTRNRKGVEFDSSGMRGLEGIAEETFSHEGMILVRGELWKATADRGIIQKGDHVRVVSSKPGLLLVVEKIEKA